MASANHTWSFSIIGGVKRVNLESGDDLVYLGELDPKLWTALSCPVTGLEIDSKTLSLIDEDKDGQIRVPDVIAAVNWITSVVKNPDDLLKSADRFPLSAINDGTAEGKTLLDSARAILKNLGKESADTITVDETSDTLKIFAGTRFNGDGVITEDSAGDDKKTAALINDIIARAGSATDRNGKPGITADIVQAFFEECSKYSAWHEKRDTAAMPFGDDTAAAYDNYCAIKAKVDDYFIRCRLASFDPQSVDVLNVQSARIETITAKDFSAGMEEIAAFPLARIDTGGMLSLSSGLNPAWRQQIAAFRELTASRLFPGRDSISEADWNTVSEAFAPYAAWMAKKDGASVEPLGLSRVQEILSGDSRQQLEKLLEQDKALESEANSIMLVDKLVRYYRDIYILLKNFVTFHEFYTPGSRAIFQAGTLYIDQRSCDLCIKVDNMAKQAQLASYSGIYLLYCDCAASATNEKMTIVAALTNGDVDDLVVGRNALFFDRKGNDWDATIVKIQENPVGIRQAFFAPYRKLSNFIESQVNKAAAAQDAKATANMSKSVESAPGASDETKTKKEPAQPFDVGKFAGIFAAIGLAIGAIGTALTSAVGGFMKLVWWKIPLAIAGLLLIISGPSMIMAYVKLRKRNLAPILDANGWAMNARVRINLTFGRTLTQLATLPRGARINLNDPFMQKKRPVIPVLMVLIIAAAIVLYFLRKQGIIHIGHW